MAPVHRWGDGSTFYMQISSIAEDFDIQYLPEDIHRAIENRFDDLPAGLFLTKTEDGRYYYSKEFSYAFFAAPFYKIMGNKGILIFNAVLFWLMILMGYLFLKKKNSDIIALLTSTAFFSLSAAFVYIFWIHAEIYNMFLITASLFFWIHYYENNDFRYLLIASFIIGISIVAKLPNLLLFIPLLFFEVYNRRIKNIALMILIMLIPILAFYGYFYIETGYQDFYGGNRLYFNGEYPFLDTLDGQIDVGKPAFSTGDESRIAYTLKKGLEYSSIGTLIKMMYNLFYYFFGRFTGMVWYYPFTVFALLSILSLFINSLRQNGTIQNLCLHIKKHPEKYLIFFGICLYISAFILLHGDNYFGGQHAVGNRYFYVYPAFLFLFGLIDPRKLLIFTLVAAIIITPVIANPINNSALPETITYNFPYKYLPLEYTQVNDLPLWINKLSYSDSTLYGLDKDVKKQGDYFILIDDSDLLIKSKKPLDSYQIIIWSSEDGNNFTVSSDQKSFTTILNKGETIVVIPSLRPVYSDNRFYLYTLSVSTAESVLMKPVSNNLL